MSRKNSYTPKQVMKALEAKISDITDAINQNQDVILSSKAGGLKLAASTITVISNPPAKRG